MDYMQGEIRVLKICNKPIFYNICCKVFNTSYSILSHLPPPFLIIVISLRIINEGSLRLKI